jgi:hypothetical protein
MAMATATVTGVGTEVLGDIKADLARHGIKLYVIAADVRLHPSYLSRMLHGTTPMSVAVAERLERAIAARIA